MMKTLAECCRGVNVKQGQFFQDAVADPAK